MSSYIFSRSNRLYVVPDSSFGVPAPVDKDNRLPAATLKCQQRVRASRRRDKTGSRTSLPQALPGLLMTAFELTTNLASWDQSRIPAYGPLIQSTLGEVPDSIQAVAVASTSGTQIQTRSPHSLRVGSAISNGSEIRFVGSVENSTAFALNVEFSETPNALALLAANCAFRPGASLLSVSICDYWDPAEGVSRMLTGATVDEFQLAVKADSYELRFAGYAADLLDSVSNQFQASRIDRFPLEPPVLPLEYSIVPPQVGQVWLGAPLNRVFTLTEASIGVKNNLHVRATDAGLSYIARIAPGRREVTSSFTLLAQTGQETTSLYAAAKNRTPISAMIQLGNQKGQMVAAFAPRVVPQIPHYRESEASLLWEFRNNVSEGVSDDEIYVAFA